MIYFCDKSLFCIFRTFLLIFSLFLQKSEVKVLKIKIVFVRVVGFKRNEGWCAISDLDNLLSLNVVLFHCSIYYSPENFIYVSKMNLLFQKPKMSLTLKS